MVPPNEYGCEYFRTTLAKWTCDRLTEDADCGTKKIIFSDKAHFDLGGYVNKQNCPLGAQKTRSYILKSGRIQNESLFGADFGPEAQLGHFSSKMSKDKPLQSMAIVIKPC